MDIQHVSKKLTIGLSISIVALAVLSVVSFIVFEDVLRDNTAGASLVNIGGRQHLLSQQITSLARQILASDDKDSSGYLRGELIEAVGLMERSHHTLTRGNDSSNLPAAMSKEIGAIYYGPKGFLDQDLTTYLSHARSLAKTGVSEFSLDNPDYQYFTKMAPEKILTALDAVVNQFQKESEQRRILLSRNHSLVLGLTLLLLLFLGVGIFRPMTRRIGQEFSERIQTEKELRDKAALLELLHRTAAESNQAESFEEAIRTCLSDLCAYKNWPVGHAYVLDTEHSTRLIPTDIWYLKDAARFKAFLDVTTKTTFESGVGLPGRVLATGHPAWIVDVTKDSNFPRARLREDIEVKAGFALPVLVGSKVVAVLEFFTAEAEKPDQSLMSALSHIGTQLGRVIERQQSANALRLSERRKNRILQSSLDAIITIDRHGRVIEFNPAAERIFQFLNPDVVGKNIAELIVPPHLREKHLAGLQNYLVTGQPRILGRRIEMTAIRADQSEFPIELTVIQVDTEGDLLFTAFIRDITKRRNAEEKSREHRSQLAHARRLSAMGEMAAGLAHELNQPLTAISSYLGGALRISHSGRVITEDTIQAIDKALQQAQRAGEIIRWLRSFIKKEEGGKTFLDICETIELVIDLAQVKARKSHIDIKLKLDKPMLKVLADPIQIQQLLLNLIWNAVEEIENSSAALRIVTVQAAVRDNKDLLVAVKNTGPVIPQEVLGQIFNPFFTTKSEGMGLGLSICQSIVEDHHGRLWVTSEVKDSTTFNFSLPTVEEDDHVDR